VAHGFLTLSLLPHLTAGAGPEVDGLRMVINYGSDRVRFLEPVRVGDRVRARQTILEAAMRRPGQWLVKTRATVDIEGREKPALIADLLTLYVVG
jgi:acyl dehydratase